MNSKTKFFWNCLRREFQIECYLIKHIMKLNFKREKTAVPQQLLESVQYLMEEIVLAEKSSPNCVVFFTLVMKNSF